MVRSVVSVVALSLLFCGTAHGVDGTSQAPVTPPGNSTEEKAAQKDLAVELGAGLLEFFHLDVFWMPNRSWSLGVGVGSFPIDALLNKAMDTSDSEKSMEEVGILLMGGIDTRLNSGRIFARWFPTKRKYLYLEGTLEVWVLEASATGTLEEIDSEETTAEVSVSAVVWVPMAGLHVGWRFMADSGFFFDFALGLNFLASPGAEVELGGTTVEELRSFPEAAEALENAQKHLTKILEDGANSITKEIRIFPTVAVRFGWAFDFW